MLLQTCAGLVLASCVAVAAFRLGALTTSGASAATLVGTIIFAAGGPTWSVLLLAFFISSSALSRLHPRAEDVVAKGGRRDAAQVLANGGIPALIALAALLVPGPNWFIPYAGALAAATADTWATEIGRLSRRGPRLITTGRSVRPGTSGGVTSLGLLASAAGAALLAGTTALTVAGIDALAVGIAGLFGSVFDSLLGATAQEIRYCPACFTETEQVTHGPCGARTLVVGGVPGLNNDMINALASLAAALVAATLTVLLGRV